MKTGTEIGKLIKELREKENKTQEQLSNELNISRSSLSNIKEEIKTLLLIFWLKYLKFLKWV